MKKERNYFIWAVAGAYLVYLAVRQFIALFTGTASIPALSAVCGLLFLAVGGAVLLREWRGYRRRYFGDGSKEEPEETGDAPAESGPESGEEPREREEEP